MNIHFVDVEAEFDKDGGHQAYSDNAWINKIILAKQSEDLDQSGLGSSYSVHPNEEGAKAYARCVNAKIREIENNKNKKNTRSVTTAPVVTEITTEAEQTTVATTTVAAEITTAAVSEENIAVTETSAAEAEITTEAAELVEEAS